MAAWRLTAEFGAKVLMLKLAAPTTTGGCADPGRMCKTFQKKYMTSMLRFLSRSWTGDAETIRRARAGGGSSIQSQAYMRGRRRTMMCGGTWRATTMVVGKDLAALQGA